MKEFKVKVSATVANLGPGFDFLGMALGIYLVASVREKEGSEIKADKEDALVSAVISLSDEKKIPLPKNISIQQDTNAIPAKSGLGSSAAARVAGVLIANKVLDLQLDSIEIVRKAAQLEGHPDNAVPAVAGGITICYNTPGGLEYEVLGPPAGLKVVIALPGLQTDTQKARKLLPDKVSVKDAVYSAARASLLVKSLVERKFNLLSEAMKDRLHQPYRKELIPGFDEIVSRSLKAGAYGTAISGSGPCVFSFAPEEAASSTGKAMVKVFNEKGIKAEYIVTDITKEGAQIIE